MSHSAHSGKALFRVTLGWVSNRWEAVQATLAGLATGLLSWGRILLGAILAGGRALCMIGRSIRSLLATIRESIWWRAVRILLLMLAFATVGLGYPFFSYMRHWNSHYFCTQQQPVMEPGVMQEVVVCRGLVGKQYPDGFAEDIFQWIFRVPSLPRREVETGFYVQDFEEETKEALLSSRFDVTDYDEWYRQLINKLRVPSGSPEWHTAEITRAQAFCNFGLAEDCLRLRRQSLENHERDIRERTEAAFDLGKVWYESPQAERLLVEYISSKTLDVQIRLACLNALTTFSPLSERQTVLLLDVVWDGSDEIEVRKKIVRSWPKKWLSASYPQLVPQLQRNDPQLVLELAAAILRLDKNHRQSRQAILQLLTEATLSQDLQVEATHTLLVSDVEGKEILDEAISVYEKGGLKLLPTLVMYAPPDEALRLLSEALAAPNSYAQRIGFISLSNAAGRFEQSRQLDRIAEIVGGMLDSTDRATRDEAVERLGGLKGSKKAETLLRRHLSSHARLDDRVITAHSLVLLGVAGSPVRDAIADALYLGDKWARARARSALGFLARENPDVRSDLLRFLHGIDVGKLRVEILKGKPIREKTVQLQPPIVGIEEFKVIPPSKPSPSLSSEDLLVASHVAGALAEAGKDVKSVTSQVLEQLRSTAYFAAEYGEDSSIQKIDPCEAAEEVTRGGSRGEYVLEVLRTLRHATLQLQKPQWPVAWRLTSFLESTNNQARLQMVYLLGELGSDDEVVVGALRRRLRDCDGDTRKAAAEALGKIYKTKGAEWSFNSLEESQSWIRTAGTEAILLVSKDLASRDQPGFEEIKQRIEKWAKRGPPHRRLAAVQVRQKLIRFSVQKQD